MTTLLSAENVSVSFAERPVLLDVSLSVTCGERVALLGRNGAGKTTLLRVLTGELKAEDGVIWRAQELRMAVLAQHHAHPAGLSVQALVDAAHPYRALEEEVLTLEANLDSEATLARWSALRTHLDEVQAYAWPSRVARVLGRLDLTRFLERETATLSGGERTRLALALALAREPDLLVLDEPTNHLDIRMREWLEGWLRDYRGGVLLTSHDRDFLDRVATRSLWLEEAQAVAYPGGYSRAAAQRELERRTLARASQLSTREAARLSHSVEWLDRRGRRSSALKTRAARVPLVEAPLPERRLRMRLLAGTAHAPLVAWGEHLSKSFGERVVLQDIAFKLRQGDRVAFMGANGTGKTTLLKLLSGEWQADPTSPPPTLRLGSGVTVASLDQTWHGLTPGESLHVQFEMRFGKQTNAILGRAGFTAADWPKTPEVLSGGERARAGLALVSSLRADLLLLDEPTNHLDIEALQALQDAVHAYTGAVVIVTHDRRFARKVANRLWLIEDAQLREVEGWGSREYLDPARGLAGDPPPPPPPATPRQQLVFVERQLLDIRAQLDQVWRLSGREEARLRAQAHLLQQHLYDLYAQAFSAPQFDEQVREPPLTVRAQRFEPTDPHGGGMFWAAHNEACPHLAWDGYTLRWNGNPPAWYGAALLGGTLRILFERWNVGRAELGDDGPILTRRHYFERLGLIRHR